MNENKIFLFADFYTPSPRFARVRTVEFHEETWVARVLHFCMFIGLVYTNVVGGYTVGIAPIPPPVNVLR